MNLENLNRVVNLLEKHFDDIVVSPREEICNIELFIDDIGYSYEIPTVFFDIEKPYIIVNKIWDWFILNRVAN